MRELPDDGLHALRDYYERFGRIEAAPVSPLYAEWATSIVGDDEVLTLISQLPRGKRQANLVFAAARVNGVPLTDWSEARGSVVAAWDGIRATAEQRLTQTNEAGRSAVLNLAFSRIDGPLALIEVGASAGLCLYPDAWPTRYVVAGGDDVVLSPGTLGSAPELTCELTGVEPPAHLPTVASRSGIDLNPLDLTDPEDLAWLEALVWPGMEYRLERLRAGAELVRSAPPTLLAGDLNARLDEALALVPEGTTPVVFHSAVLVYLPQEDRARFVDKVRDSGARWVSNEGPDVVPSVAAGLTEADRSSGGFVLALDGEPLALTGPHGQWARAIGWSFGAQRGGTRMTS